MEISEFSSFNNQNYSFENNNTILHNNSFVPEFIKIDVIEDLFKVDNILNYFTNTLINTNTKELNFDKDESLNKSCKFSLFYNQIITYIDNID
jgi:hypothetical protein